MMDELKPYKEYRKSGLPWADKMPAHWELVPNRAIMRKRKVLVGERHHEYKLLSLTKAGVVIRDVDSGKGKFSADMGTSQEVRAGDLVFCLFDVPETPRTVGLSSHDGMITGAYTVFESGDELARRFIARFYESMDDGKLLSPLYSGLRNTIPPPRFLGVKTPLPPRDEQTAIVKYLDHIDRRINRYIRAKRKLIALLNEQKQGIIHRAVTRGLDPNVKLKPSGVEWLGDVPAHWEVVPFKARVKFQEGPGIMRADFREDGVPLLRISGLLDPHNGLAGCNYLEPSMVERRWSHFAIRQGDYILSASTSSSTVQVKEARPEMRGAIPYTGLIRLWSPLSSVDMGYICNVVKSPQFQQQLKLMRSGVGIAHFGPSHLSKLWIALPPEEEQRHLRGWIEKEAEEVTNAVAAAEAQISYMREYRNRLIGDVVTGKLDVRAVAAKLPDVPHDEPAEALADEAEPEDNEPIEEEAAEAAE